MTAQQLQGFSGYEMGTQQVPQTPFLLGSFGIQCPTAGKKVLGGGGTQGDGAFLMTASGPVDEDTWVVAWKGNGTRFSGNVYIICANVS